MGRAVSAGLVLLALMTCFSGCANLATTPTVISAQQECERNGGSWRMNFCERSSGGGGY